MVPGNDVIFTMAPKYFKQHPLRVTGASFPDCVHIRRCTPSESTDHASALTAAVSSSHQSVDLRSYSRRCFRCCGPTISGFPSQSRFESFPVLLKIHFSFNWKFDAPRNVSPFFRSISASISEFSNF